MAKQKKLIQTDPWWKEYATHAGIILGFLLLLVIYFKPVVFDGMVIAQPDYKQFKAMSKEVADFRDANGEEALWTNSMFGGMPAFQLGTRYYDNLFYSLNNILHFGLPAPVHLFFMTFLGFYFMLIVLRVNPYLSGLGALAFTLSSYFFVIMEAGHTSKLNAIAYMGPVIAGVITAYRGRILLGSAITLFFLALEFAANHYQIAYYLAITILLLFIAFLIRAIQKGDISNFIKASGALLVVLVLAIGPNIARMWTTYEYGQETIRGKSELTTADGDKSSGLDKEYALRWSYGVAESFTFLIPNFHGGASTNKMNENSATYEVLKKNYGVRTAEQAIERWPAYWGDQPFTGGPVYAGALVCFLFVLGLILIKGPMKWWLLAATILSFMLSWGRNMMWFTDFFFYNFPMYSKFRAVAMILIIAEFTMPLLGILALQKIFDKDNGLSKENTLKSIYIAGGITAGLALLFALAGPIFMDFTAAGDKGTLSRIFRLEGTSPVLLDMLDALREDRVSMLRMDGLRSAFFILLGGGLLWLYVNEKLKTNYVIAGLAIVMMVDMFPVDRRYLDDKAFEKSNSYSSKFRPSKADQAILQDKGLSHRVLNLTTDTFNESLTSYFHKCIGGYHAAKLRRYQDLIERNISPEMSQLTNLFRQQPSDSALQVGLSRLNVLNMLNTKYFIYNPEAPPLLNRYALGNAWFVGGTRFVKNADEEIAALNGLDTRSAAIVDERFQSQFEGLTPKLDPGATVRLTSYSPKELVYEANSTGKQIMIFSEIYYNDDKGWKAYIDGDPVPHFRANYVLRGLVYPGGKHTVTFRFEPRSFYTGKTLSLLFSILALVVVAGILFYEYRKSKKPVAGDA